VNNTYNQCKGNADTSKLHCDQVAYGDYQQCLNQCAGQGGGCAAACQTSYTIEQQACTQAYNNAMFGCNAQRDGGMQGCNSQETSCLNGCSQSCPTARLPDINYENQMKEKLGI